MRSLAKLCQSVKFAPCRALRRARRSLATDNLPSRKSHIAAAKDKEDPDAPVPIDPEPHSAYIHLPFCKKKCLYCDFPVIAVGMKPDTPTTLDNMQAYVDLLCTEIAATKKLNDSGPLNTIFFGGGTPSLIPPAMLERILTTLEKKFGIAFGAEISIEADPGTFNAAQLRSYRSLGISRVSVGVQSFEDELLSTCGRAHDVADAYRAIEAIYAAEIPTWSLDLMSGLPGLTIDSWQKSLSAALDCQPKHISVYDLQIEEHTPFAKQYRPGVSPLPDDESAAIMYRDASAILRSAGYEHYELSNYALPGHRCKHNMVYWEGQPFYGFGLGAASYLHGRRFSRPKRIGGYRTWVETFDSQVQEAGGLPAVPGLELPRELPEDVLPDTIMLRLRLKDGLDLDMLQLKVLDGAEAVDIVLNTVKEKGMEERGLVEFITSKKDDAGSNGDRNLTGSERQSRDFSTSKKETTVIMKLTDPEGLLLSNDVISDIFAALDITQGEMD